MSVEIMSNRRYFDEHIAPKFSFLKDIRSFFYYIVVLIVLGFGFFAYALYNQDFTTPYGGDFAQQGYAFMYNVYDSWWTFFKTGEFPNFVHNVFIGADNVQANTFYSLFSPFSIPILFFPREWIPQVMSLMSVARLVTGALIFRLYLKKMGVSERSARLFSIAYAFTGWMAYYLWFNSFYEILTFMPLIVLGVEQIIKDKKVWIIWLGFFFIGLSNYFFLLTAGIYGVIYAIFRFFQTIKERKLSDQFKIIGFGLLGFILGATSSFIITLPALIPSFMINRAESSMYFTNLKDAFKHQDWDTVFSYLFYTWNPNVANNGTSPSTYWFAQYFPLYSFFFPVVSDRYTNLVHLDYFENTAVGLFCYTPILILFFASLFVSIKKRKISHIVAFLMITFMLFTPFFYFLSGAFANSYGRWAIVVPITLITYVAFNFDHKDEIPKPIILLSGLVTFGIQLLLFFKSEEIIATYANIVSSEPVKWLIFYEGVLVAVESALMTGFWKSKHLNKFMTAFLAVEIVAMGTFVANYHGLQNIRTSVNGGYNNFVIEQKLFDGIKEEDDSFYRIIFTRAKEGTPNLPEALGYNGASTFHTFYNNEVDEFQRLSLVLKGDTAWSGSVFAKRSNLDEFLGVKYYVTKDSETSYTYTRSDGSKYVVVYEPNIPLGFELYKQENGYRIYKNKYYLDFGTSHKTLYYLNACAGSVTNNFYPSAVANVIRNEEVYFKGAILNNSDIHEIELEYGDTFSYTTAAPSREATQLSTKAVKIYRNQDNKSFAPSNPDRDINDDCLVDTTTDKNVSKYQIVFEPKYSDYFTIGEEGGYYMLDYPVAHKSGVENFNAVIWLIGEDEQGNSKVIAFDECRNNTRNGNAAGGAKMIRGFYSKEKIKRIIVCPTGGKFRTSMPIYYEPFEKTIARYEEAINNGVTNVQNYVDKFTFESNYSEDRYFVSQVAYTSGWKVKATSETGEVSYPKVYKAQGGFVSFVAPKGHIYYEMTYSTPYMDVSSVISAVSLVSMLSVTIFTPIIVKKKKASKEA